MKRQAIFLLFAVTAAALAALMVNSALKLREAAIARAQAQSIEIVVAAHDLPLGSRIDQSSVKLVRWSRDALPPGLIADMQAIMNDYVRRELVTNEPITSEALFTSDKSAGVMPLVIPPGMRAVSVQVDEVSDIAGFVLPGARVDVLAALNGTSEAGQKAISKIVLENVEVLAVAQEMEGQKDQPELVKVVTLLVKPDEAEVLALASHEGVLRLAMRNYSDHAIVQTAGTDLSHLLTAYSPAAPRAARKGRISAPQPEPVTVEIMRDGKAMHPAEFVNQASIEPASPAQASQWAPVNHDKSGTPLPSVQPPSPPADQQNKNLAMATSAPSPTLAPAASTNGQGAEAGGTDRKTIDVDP